MPLSGVNSNKNMEDVTNKMLVGYTYAKRTNTMLPRYPHIQISKQQKACFDNWMTHYQDASISGQKCPDVKSCSAYDSISGHFDYRTLNIRNSDVRISSLP